METRGERAIFETWRTLEVKEEGGIEDEGVILETGEKRVILKHEETVDEAGKETEKG